ncbi:MAG: hypothetical protein DMG49_17900 [Acidobacteria bacterium]|nr:MAG: hypothetical protein DMG49_17900 [Acidobacteriota bacterium]
MQAWAGVPLIVREPPKACAVCDGGMNVQKTIRRTVRTLTHGSFQAQVTIFVCASHCQKQNHLVTARSSSLAQLLVPHCTVGYDVLVYVGCQRFLHYRQREEIRTDLGKRYGIVLSTGEISALGRRFLVYLQALHKKRAPALRAALEADGGWPLHIDATGEDGRGTMVTAWAGWRNWVLSAWKAPTERAEFILPGIERVAAEFGAPCAIVRDLGRAMTEAAAQYVQSRKKPIPVLACHQHFLADIGEDLLQEEHHQLRDGFRQIRLLPRLRAFVRQQGRHLGESIGLGREALDRWLEETGRTHGLPKGVGGIVAVRSMAQWVLDYHDEGSGLGFPFDLPWLDLFCRGLQLLAAVRTFRRTVPADTPIRKALETLERMLRPLEGNQPPLLLIQDALSKRADLFHRLRVVLRLEEKNPTAKKLDQIQAALQHLEASLRSKRPERGPAKDTRGAIDLILAHLDRHGPHLWGHAIRIPRRAGGGIGLVARTNNGLESLFHTIKHGERRRSGRKILTQDFEVLPPAAALATNLHHGDYVTLVCGSLDRLPEAFAQLDATHRSRSIAVGAEQKGTTAETASLSTIDKRFVRREIFEDYILAAAKSAA